MAVDLKSISTFERFSLLLMNDSLVKLEHERTQDRIRRFSYDTIQYAVFWQRTPWVRIIVCTVLLVGPGVGILFAQQEATTVIGIILMAIGGALILYYALCKSTTIRIVRGNKLYDSKGIFRPGKLRKFKEKLLANIATAQAGNIPSTPIAAAPPPIAQQPIEVFGQPETTAGEPPQV